MAQAWGTRPAELLGIAEPWWAWMTDRATLALGVYVESKLAETDKRGKPRWTVEQILAGEARKRRGSFAQLVATFGAAAAPAGTASE